jgi:hypothetical protein
MNKKNWKLYKENEVGTKTIKAFSALYEDTDTESLIEGIDYIFKLTDVYYETLCEFKMNRIFSLFIPMLTEEEIFEVDCVSKDDFEKFIDTFDSKTFRSLASEMDLLSIVLSLLHPFFKPMLMPSEFYRFQNACQRLNIDLPAIPRSNDYKKYLLYYYDICKSLNTYQDENKLSEEELCACVYDYALIYLGNNDDDYSNLPDPTNIWLVGASKEDIKEIEEKGVTSSIWQCSEFTRRGDIVVMYARTPHSCIHSIWRASSGGFFNPFDYYHCRTTVQDGIMVPHIKNSELKQHPYFSQLPIVRKNMQGVNGVELSVQDYTELLKLLEHKGGDISALPKVLDITDYEVPNTPLEKDVEEKILIPFLEKIGYSSDDYTRQLMQKVGRKEKAIPDFVFFPQEQGRHLNIAPFLIEAKLDFKSAQQRQEDFRQALSYAMALQSPLFAICDKERLVIYKSQNADIMNPLFENHWAVIHTNPEVFQQIKKTIGKESILKLQQDK